MPSPRLLVIEGNSPQTMAEHLAAGGVPASENYAALLRDLLPGAQVDACYPADLSASLPQGQALEGYDGVAITGSSPPPMMARSKSAMWFVCLIRPVGSDNGRERGLSQGIYGPKSHENPCRVANPPRLRHTGASLSRPNGSPSYPHALPPPACDRR